MGNRPRRSPGNGQQPQTQRTTTAGRRRRNRLGQAVSPNALFASRSRPRSETR
jgi:hypothetical protein